MRIAGSLLPMMLAVACSSLTAQTTEAAKVALPHGAGNLDLPKGWTALGETELLAESRESDPVQDPGRMLVMSIITQLRIDKRTKDNVLLHAPGASTGHVRTIDAYSDDLSVTSENLQREKSVNQVRQALEERLTKGGSEVVFLGSSEPTLFPIGSISVTFRLKLGDQTFHNQMYVVPAGERLQYFETQFSPDDLDAPIAIANVLGTFDGAAQAGEDSILNKMILGGVAGALAGIMVALLRRRRRQAPRIGVES